MRKWITSTLVFTLVLSLAACTNGVDDERNTPPSSPEPPASNSTGILEQTIGEQESGWQSNDGEKILIAYFTRVGNTDFDENVSAISSASLNKMDGTLIGNTQLIAEMIHDKVGGDMFLITTTNKYPEDYDEVVDFAAEEQDRNHRPELNTHVVDMDDYDTIFLGFPNWWYDMPMAIYSFLEEYNFSGKRLVPFNTSGGSGFSDSIRTLRKMLPDSTVLDGFTVRDSKADRAKDDVLKWLTELENTY